MWMTTNVARAVNLNNFLQTFGLIQSVHDWLLANARACVSCGFHLRNARKTQAIAFKWKPGLRVTAKPIRVTGASTKRTESSHVGEAGGCRYL